MTIYRLSCLFTVTFLDINECGEGLDGCQQNCTNTVGGYQCSCSNSTYLSNDNQTCLDINECANSTLNNCHENATCTNIYGSFFCKCCSGFEGDGTKCTGKEWEDWYSCLFCCLMFFWSILFLFVCLFVCFCCCFRFFLHFSWSLKAYICKIWKILKMHSVKRNLIIFLFYRKLMFRSWDFNFSNFKLFYQL